MDKLKVKKVNELKGTIEVSRSKNACLPLLAGALLVPGKITFKSLPKLRDIITIQKILEDLGVKIERNGDDTTLDISKLSSVEATYELVKTMRASIFILGPLLGRFKKAKVSLPGGCAIGSRPIDLHLKNLEKMGAKITLEAGYVQAETDGLKGAHLILDFPSVGATENLLMAGVYAEGTTIIENAALEPEIDDLANFLNLHGAKISGIGTKVLTVEGVKELKTDLSYKAIGDRIEAGTYVMAALATKGHVIVKGFNPKHIEFVLTKLEDMGAKFNIFENSVEVFPSSLETTTIETAPYPGFPTDLQAQMMSLLLQIDGTSIVTENIFENRFMHIPELQRLGARIKVKGNSAIIEGGNPLKAAPVMCTDLRASAALVMAAMVAEGETEVLRVYHLDRGYEEIERKLSGLGVEIFRENPGPNVDL